MLGRIASDWTSRISAAWDHLPDGRLRRSAPVAASLVVNLGLLLALTAFASGAGRLPPTPITLTLVSGDTPRVATVLPPPPPPKPAPASPASPRTRAPTAPSNAETAPPLTLPETKGNAPGVETIPAETGTMSPAVPKGLQRYLQADPCADANTRKLHPECKSVLKAATDALPDREARADRTERVRQAELDLGLHNDCGSTHMGCALPEKKTTIGANPVGPEMGSGVVKQYGNSYHRDPAFGD